MIMASAKEKMRVNPAYPSDTEFFFGMTAEENASMPYPYPPIAETSVTVRPGGGITISHNAPAGRVAKVPAELLINPVLRQLGFTRDQVNIIWT